MHMVHRQTCRQNMHIHKINIFLSEEEGGKSLTIKQNACICIKTEWATPFPLPWVPGWLNGDLLWDVQLSGVSRGGRQLDIYQTPQSTGPWRVRNICLACSVESPEDCPRMCEHFVCLGWCCLSSLEAELLVWKPQMMECYFLMSFQGPLDHPIGECRPLEASRPRL